MYPPGAVPCLSLKGSPCWEAWGEQTVVKIQSDMLAKGHCGELQCILEGHPKGLGTSRKAALALNLQKSACEIWGQRIKRKNLSSRTREIY